MSYAGFFFGNVDKSGKVEDLPEEFREALESLENSEQLTHLFSAKTLGVEDNEAQAQGASGAADNNEEEEEEDQDGEVNFATIKSSFEHDKDAVDYSEINDLAVDNTEQMFSNRYLQKGLSAVKATATTAMRSGSLVKGKSTSRLDSMDEDYDAEDTDVEDTPKPGSHRQSPSLTPAEKPPLSLLQRQQLYLMEEQQKQQQQQQPSTSGSTISKPVPLPTSLPALPGAASTTAPTEPIDIHAIYPAFEEKKILKFSELFNTKRPKRFPHSRAKPAEFPTSNKFSRSYDQRKLFDKPEDPSSNKEQFMDYYDAIEEPVDREWANSLQWKVPDSKDFYSLQLESWEEKIIWDDALVPSEKSGMNKNEKSPAKRSNKTPDELFTVRNYDLENGGWEESIIWDENKPYKPFAHVSLNMNDPNVLFDFTSMDSKAMGDGFRVKRGKKVIFPAYRVVTNTNDPSEAETHRKLQIDRFNLSNDRFYEAHKEGRFHRVRQTFGQLVVQHALPAIKLMKPWYKNKLTKPEQRSFHRPQLQVVPNVDITFSRVKGKKKKLKRKELGEVMRSSKDLTLRDHTNFILLEYSEEHPAIVQNVGMGSFLINYYRKESIEDTYIPQAEIGEPFVLDIADASPFLGFGNVEPGQTISALYNNMIRAPVFEQPARNTDFLVIRNTSKSETKYYIRHIPHLYVVGQTYPVQDVPGPHSRKITTMIKNRLQISAFRFIRKDPYNRLRFAKLVKAYPEYSEIQIRQRLKEFAEFQRKGNNTGFWKLKASTPLPSEEEIRKLVTPEMVCLYESMLVGQRYLQDAGYGRAADGEDDGNEDNEANMDIEEQLAPWITTRNFINATQGKAMLKLWGAGDPTGRGEGFSFVRISMKDIFLRQGESLEERLAQIELLPKSTHRYNVAEQQQVYREEITRIWNTQHQALSKIEEIDGKDDEIAGDDEDEEESYNRQRREMSTADRNRVSPSPSLFGRYRDSGDRDRDRDMDDDNVSVAGSIGSRASVGNLGSSRNKYLIIKRLVRQENGESVWKSETIRDPAVMNAYIRQRQLIEESSISTEALEPTNDEAKNQRMKKRIMEEIARLNRNQERRRARAAAKAGTSTLELPPVNPATATLKKKVVRQCSNCGALGHMKTNKKCPKYVDPSGALPNLGVTGTAYVTSGGAGGSMMSPPHVAIRQTSIPPATPALARSTTSNSDYFRQGSPQSTTAATSNKISIPKAVIDRVVDLEKEREREDKEALVVRLPSKMLHDPFAEAAPKRKRSESASQQNDLEDFMDYYPPVKSYGRRKKPDVELANIIENVLATILSMQEATAFLSPVSSKIAPGYDIVIKHPRDLTGMRDANKNSYAYRTVDAFLTDMRIMVNNSWHYNGEHSPWTKAAIVLLEKAEEILKPQMETIRQLEQEILDADTKANIYGGLNTPGGGAAGIPPPTLPNIHPGGYGVYNSLTFPGIGKPFIGFTSPPARSHSNSSSNLSSAATSTMPGLPPGPTNNLGTAEVQVKSETMEWE